MLGRGSYRALLLEAEWSVLGGFAARRTMALYTTSSIL